MKASNISLKSELPLARTTQRARRAKLAMRVTAMLILTALVAVSLYLSASVSASKAERSKRIRATKKINTSSSVNNISGAFGSILGRIEAMLVPQAQPSVTTYAADCVTPRSSFNLGEVVCAKTDGVDLVTTPGNYYMNWIDSQLNQTNGGTITQNPQFFLFAPPTADTWKATIGRVTPPDSSIVGNPPLFTVSSSRPGIGIFAGDGSGGCTNTPKSVFNLQDANKDVCAKVVGGQANQHILWSNAEFKVVQDVPLGTGENVFILSALSSLGDWRVILFEPFGGSVYAVTPFTVIDAANPNADLTIGKNSADDTVAAGSQAVFTVQLTNLGPTDATNVQVSDSIPANTTFASFAAVSAPGGTNCALPGVGASSGQSVCTIPILARGETATFLAAYDVPSGTASGTVISNTASVATAQPLPTDPPAVPDPNPDNNSSTATLRVEGTTAETCTLDCPANVVVTADTTQGGQPGAFVTFAAAVPAGNCGSVTNSPASGSFFTVGTHSVISQSQLNATSCTFTVTVLDTNPPTITCPANRTVNEGDDDVDPCTPGTDEACVNVGTPTINASGGGTVTGIRSDDDADPLTPPKPLTDPYPVGATGIHWTVTDAGGRTASCDQSITVVDAGNRPPVTISCPGNVTVTASSGCSTTIPSSTIGTPTTVPSDSNVTVEADRSDGLSLSDPFPAGITQITWTATDSVNGSTASCVQNVTVNPAAGADTTPPTLTVPANVITTTSTCTVILDDELGVAEATDTGACSASVTISRTGVPAGNVFPTGTTTIIYTATDAAGNSTQGVQLVTVTESPAVLPAISCPANITLEPTCPTGAKATWTPPVGTDNCPGAVTTRTAGGAPGSVFPVGTTTVTYSVTDASGNGPVSCSFTVTVITTQNVIQNLIAAVQASSLSNNVKNNLINRLNSALTAINAGQQAQACQRLNEFTNSVQQQINNGNLPAATGNAWISSANNVKNTIGCTTLPCS